MSDKVYDRAWKLLCDPSRWCQDAFAKDCTGDDRSSKDATAVRWCAQGAIYKVYNYEGRKQMDALEAVVPLGNIPAWNDSVTHAEVFKTLKELDI